MARPRRRDSDVLAAFATRMRERRLALELSQEALAQRADVHRTYVSNIERGNVNISLANALRIARALEIGLDWMLERVE